MSVSLLKCVNKPPQTQSWYGHHFALVPLNLRKAYDVASSGHLRSLLLFVFV